MSRPSPATLLAFALVTIIGGSNFVAVRFSNRELDPFWGAGLRFTLASALLFAIVGLTRTQLPGGRALTGAVIFGALNFFAAYAFAYWGLQEAPAALAGVVFGAVPLLTLILAAVQRLEAFRWRSAFGAAIAIAGVTVMAGAPANAAVPLASFLAIVASAVGAAQAAVHIKRFPPVHPFAMNAIAMAVGAVLLLTLAAISGERFTLPTRPTTWYALAFVIPVGSVALFILYVFVVQRWTASAASYQFVLFPVVAAVVGSLVAGESLNASIALGGVLVVGGTYIGALARPGNVQPAEAPVS